MSDILDDYFAGNRPAREQGDPLDNVLSQVAHQRAAAGVQANDNPDKVGRANQIARKVGMPATVVEANLPVFEGQEQTNRLREMSQNIGGFRRWASNPRNAALAKDDDDTIKRIARIVGTKPQEDVADFSKGNGFFDRMGDVLKRSLYSIDQGAASFRGALQEWSANNPLPWTSVENQQREARAAAESKGIARVYGQVSNTAIANETKWSDVKAAPSLRSVGGFILDQGVGSVPAMALAAVGLPMSIAAQAGTIGQQRAQNQGREDATIGDIGVSLPAATLSSLLDRYGLESILTATGKNIITRTAKAAATEGGTEFIQSIVEYAGSNLGTAKGFTWGDALDQGFAGALAGAGMGGGMHVSVEGVNTAGQKLVTRMGRANAALNNDAALNDVMEAAAQSKTRGRDPEAFKALMEEIGKDGEVNNLYVPADALQTYMQSEGYSGEFESYRSAIEEGLATGGDVVIPLADAAANLAGTKAWEAIRPDTRTSAGGVSPREAQTFNESMADVMADLADQMDQQGQADKAAAAPREQLLQSVTQKLQDAGFTPYTARQQAELLTQRAATRASRLGQALTGTEYDNLAVNQVLPAGLAAAQKADRLDFVINAMKRNADVAAKPGVSLLEFIAEKGGVQDAGGDLAAMGAQDWHKGKAFKKNLIQDNGRTLDDLAMAAYEAGYFPGLQDRPTINDLLDVMGAELGGSPVFANFASEDAAAGATAQAELVQATDELRSLLTDAGINPETATTREIRATVAEYQAQAEGVGFDQAFNDGPRGRITFPTSGYGRGKTIIDLFQSRDSSTFLHETGHLWLEELRFDALDPNAPDQLKADWQAVQDWFASNGRPLQDGTIPVDAHELWARGVERYLMEGKAPSPALRTLFEAFKSWLVQVYRTVAKLNSPISDDIRAVMDRLIATDEEIANAREEQAIEAAFTEKPATMSDGEWQDYQRLVSEGRDEANSAMLAKVMGAIKRRVTKEYNDQKATVREEVKAEIDAKPEFKALKQLRETPMDQGTLADIYGPDALAMLPKQVPPVYKTGGVALDDIAEMSGFTSADDMVRILMGVETRRRQLREGGDQRSVREVMIAQETDARMLARYGDPFTDGSIEEEALAAIHNDKAGEVMAAELRVLSRGTRNRPTPYSVAKAWASKTIRDGTVSEVASRAAVQRYRRAASKAGKAFQEAIVSGMTDDAFKAKQAQMLNNALLAEATRVQQDIDAAVKRLSNVAKRRNIKSVDQDYLERAQALLAAVDMAPRSQKSIDRQAGFEAWAHEQEALGHDVVVPASFAASLGTTHWSRLSVDQLLGLDAAVSQIIYLGRFKRTLLDGQEAREKEEVIREAEGQGDRIGRKPPTDLQNPGWGDRFKAGVFAADAALLKMETIFDWLDEGRSDGVFNRVVFKPIADAEAREKSMLADYYARVRTAFEGVDKDQLKRWQERFSTPELMNRETGNPRIFRRSDLIAMALNMGNEGNIQRLVDGYGYNEQTVRDVLNRELTAQDWQFVQTIWDMIDTLWPEVSALERKINGVEPEKVEAVPVQTPHGTLKGGYYPAIYDSTKSYAAEYNEGRASDLFGVNYQRSTTRAASTKDRSAKVTRPILLDLGVINRHLGEVIHDITHREAVINADKFLSEPRIQRLVDDVLNPEIRKQFRPWLQFVANQWAMERSGNEVIGKFLQKTRANTTVVGMGFRFTTILTQLAGYSNSFEKVGFAWVAPQLRNIANPKAWNFVLERSAEVRNRLDTLDRDINATMREMAGSNKTASTLTAAKRFAFHGIGYMDRVVVIPTWLGAYNKAVASGMDEQASIYEADKAVRESQGTSSAKDMAAIQRGTGKHGEMLKAMTMFYSYMSAYYQRQRTLARDIGSAGPRDLPALMARAWWLIIVPPVLSQILGGNGPEEDEDWSLWAFKEMLFNSMGAIPLARDMVRPVWDKAAGNKGFDYQMSPLQRAFQTVINSFGDLGKVARGEDTKRATRNALEAVGYTTGLVPGQVASSAQFLVDIGDGDADPQTISQWYEGLTKGRIKED